MANNNNMKKIQFNTIRPEQDLFRKMRSDKHFNELFCTNFIGGINYQHFVAWHYSGLQSERDVSSWFSLRW